MWKVWTVYRNKLRTNKIAHHEVGRFNNLHGYGFVGGCCGRWVLWFCLSVTNLVVMLKFRNPVVIKADPVIKLNLIFLYSEEDAGNYKKVEFHDVIV